VQSAIGDQLARKILGGEIRDGDHVLVDVDVETDSLDVSSTR
jgi:ATP-dependent Clp protease ATP-binding subunit ClpB